MQKQQQQQKKLSNALELVLNKIFAEYLNQSAKARMASTMFCLSIIIISLGSKTLNRAISHSVLLVF